jgi:hypothetical protein
MYREKYLETLERKRKETGDDLRSKAKDVELGETGVQVGFQLKTITDSK